MEAATFVAALSERSPAAVALRTEGVVPDVRVLTTPTGYGEVLAGVWGRGQGFVLVEHDVVPWPGACAEMADCPELWCAFRYPMGGRDVFSLGCMRFSDRLVADHPELADGWELVPWHDLEGAVLGAVRHATGLDYPHFHLPNVAHTRHLETV